MAESPFYKEVRRRAGLRSAWNKVRQNGLKSKCEKTRREIKEFSPDAEKHIEKIYRKLQRKKWKFEPAEGILITHPGKKPRPIVKSSIPNRIVQRSILDVLQGEPAIAKFFQVETSFGGIKDRSVRKAIEAACTAISNGAKFFVRSDIKKFFPNIPRDYVKKQISELIPDTEFNKLLSEATDTELKNLGSLKKQSELFPLYEVGVAQGCCLSPLIGNILLYDFDVKMNGRGITCLRYIDDFIILGPNSSKTISAFKSAKQYLKKFKLDAYDPQTEREKAEIGEVRHGFEYLGCEIVPGLISPNKKSRKRLLSSIDQIFQRSIKLMSDPNKMYLERATVSETLLNVSNVLRGWGNQYSFCNNRQIIQNMDLQIDRRLEKYLAAYKKKKKDLEDRDFLKNRRRLIGVHLLEDSKYDPILE